MKEVKRIYQTVLNLEEETGITYIILTETSDYIPVRCYIYKVPDCISHQQLTSIEQRYYPIYEN
jgi:hypothetical protein